MWLSGQYQRATRTPCGVLRSYVPCRAREQPPCGCFGHCSRIASRHAWAVTYCSPVSPVSKRSCTGHGPTGVHSPRASFLFSERPRLRPHPLRRQAVKPWTRPADRSASYGPCGQPVDKLALAHRLTTLADLATTAPPLPQQQGMMLRMKRSAAASPLPAFGHHPGKIQQPINVTKNPELLSS